MYNNDIDLQIVSQKNWDCTPSQLAIAWTIANGALPIPGMKRINYLEENVASLDVELTSEDLQRIDALMPKNAVLGNRY